jgi:hypothetical protein
VNTRLGRGTEAVVTFFQSPEPAGLRKRSKQLVELVHLFLDVNILFKEPGANRSPGGVLGHIANANRIAVGSLQAVVSNVADQRIVDACISLVPVSKRKQLYLAMAGEIMQVNLFLSDAVALLTSDP